MLVTLEHMVRNPFPFLLYFNINFTDMSPVTTCHMTVTTFAHRVVVPISDIEVFLLNPTITSCTMKNDAEGLLPIVFTHALKHATELI